MGVSREWSDVTPEPPAIDLLLPYVAEGRRAEFRAYVDEYLRDNETGLDHGYLGFLDDYVNYASLLVRKASIQGAGHGAMHHMLGTKRCADCPPPLTVYDVGCGSAFQHVLFDPRIRYVGIDHGGRREPRFFRDGCTYIRATFSDIVEALAVDPENSIGIANMSLYYMHPEGDLAVFDRTFRRKFIL